MSLGFNLSFVFRSVFRPGFCEANLDFGLCGPWMHVVDVKKERIEELFPLPHQACKLTLLPSDL